MVTIYLSQTVYTHTHTNLTNWSTIRIGFGIPFGQIFSKGELKVMMEKSFCLFPDCIYLLFCSWLWLESEDLIFVQVLLPTWGNLVAMLLTIYHVIVAIINLLNLNIEKINIGTTQ